MRSLFRHMCLVLGALTLTACQTALPLHSQTQKTAQRLQAQSQTSSFPEAWEGQWRGGCTALGPGGKQRFEPFEMGLKIAPLSAQRWQWEITYLGAQLNQVRAYELQVLDAQQGHYLLDEKNGILIDHFAVSDQVVIQQFAVNQSMITGRHEMRNGAIEVELSTFSRQSQRQSGTGVHQVEAYPLLTVQRCRLLRQ